jgi:hypothetical protein
MTAKLPETLPTPKAQPAQNSETYRPTWVEEFNRETVEVAERKRREAEMAAAREAAKQAEQARQAKLARLAKEAELEAARQHARAQEVRASSSSIMDWVSRGKSD